MRKIMLLFVLVTLLMVGVGASPVSAAPCFGMTCNGYDPAAKGCDRAPYGATTMDSFMYGPYHYFELRYSSGCNAVWTRISVDVRGSCTSTIFGQIRGYDLNNSTSLKISHGVQAPCGGQKRWTKMISFSNYWVRACESGWFSGPVNVCTNKH